MRREIEYLTPTVIAAQPGYRCAWFSLKGPPDEITAPDDLIMHSEPIIAWVIRIGMIPVPGGTVEFTEPHVHPVLPSFSVTDREFVVGPTEQWSRYEHLFRDEAEAREVWLAEQRESDRDRETRPGDIR